jgi:hypothetical protein
MTASREKDDNQRGETMSIPEYRQRDWPSSSDADEPESDPNMVTFAGRQFSRPPTRPVEWLAFGIGLAAVFVVVMGLLASAAPKVPPYRPPAQPAWANDPTFWPKGSTPSEMCAHHAGGVSQGLWYGSGQLAGVVCADGANESLSPP